jgi:hypothetical protein
VVYLLGSLLIFTDDSGRKNFMAEPIQLIFAATVVLALIGAALLPRWRRGPARTSAAAPHPIWVGVVVLVIHLISWPLTGWAAVGARTLAVVAGAAIIVAWSRRRGRAPAPGGGADAAAGRGWGQRHVLAAWAAGLVVVAVGAYLIPNYEPATPAESLIGDIAISVITAALLCGAFWRLRGETVTHAGPESSMRGAEPTGQRDIEPRP